MTRTHHARIRAAARKIVEAAAELHALHAELATDPIAKFIADTARAVREAPAALIDAVWADEDDHKKRFGKLPAVDAAETTGERR